MTAQPQGARDDARARAHRLPETTDTRRRGCHRMQERPTPPPARIRRATFALVYPQRGSRRIDHHFLPGKGGPDQTPPPIRHLWVPYRAGSARCPALHPAPLARLGQRPLLHRPIPTLSNGFPIDNLGQFPISAKPFGRTGTSRATKSCETRLQGVGKRASTHSGRIP